MSSSKEGAFWHPLVNKSDAVEFLNSFSQGESSVR